jgi:hypothetical protein
MDPSIYMMKFIIILKIILHNINSVKIIRAQKPKLIPKIKCTMLLEYLYYMYYNTWPKNAPKGVTVVCFHLIRRQQHQDDKLWVREKEQANLY